MAVAPIKEFAFDPHNFPGNIHRAIGLAVTCGAQTESVIAMAIAGCLGLDVEYGAAVTTHMTLPLKFSVLRSAAEIRIDSLDDLDTLDLLLDEVDKALGKRHIWAHANLCKDQDTGELFLIKQVARSRLEGDRVPVSAASIRADAETIYKAGMDLMAFITERGLLPALITPPRPRGHKAKAARKRRRKD